MKTSTKTLLATLALVTLGTVYNFTHTMTLKPSKVEAPAESQKPLKTLHSETLSIDTDFTLELGGMACEISFENKTRDAAIVVLGNEGATWDKQISAQKITLRHQGALDEDSNSSLKVQLVLPASFSTLSLILQAGKCEINGETLDAKKLALAFSAGKNRLSLQDLKSDSFKLESSACDTSISIAKLALQQDWQAESNAGKLNIEVGTLNAAENSKLNFANNAGKTHIALSGIANYAITGKNSVGKLTITSPTKEEKSYQGLESSFSLQQGTAGPKIQVENQAGNMEIFF